MVQRAADEISGRSELAATATLRWLVPVAAAATLLVLALGAWQFLDSGSREAMPPAAVQAEPAPERPAEAAEPAVPEGNGTPVAATPAEPEAIAEPADPEPPAETLDEQLRLARDVTFSEAAFATLFDIWGVTFDVSAGDPCVQAANAGLAIASAAPGPVCGSSIDQPFLR